LVCPSLLMSEGLQKDSYCLEGVLISIILKALLFLIQIFCWGEGGGVKHVKHSSLLAYSCQKWQRGKERGQRVLCIYHKRESAISEKTHAVYISRVLLSEKPFTSFLSFIMYRPLTLCVFVCVCVCTKKDCKCAHMPLTLNAQETMSKGKHGRRFIFYSYICCYLLLLI
jgi:hypothetical protein